MILTEDNLGYEFIKNNETHWWLFEDNLKFYLYDEVSLKNISKSEAIVLFIAAHKRGLRFNEIQRFICEMNNVDYDERRTVYTIINKDGLCKRTVRDGHFIVMEGHLWIKYPHFDPQDMIIYQGKIVGSRKENGLINRGYYCTHLLGDWNSVGLLHNCCYKHEGRWYVKSTIKKLIEHGRKFYWNPARKGRVVR